MIGAFESTVRIRPQKTCFTFVGKDGAQEAYSYREVRMISAALARILRSRNVRPGDGVAIDLPNCPAFVFLMLAAAYGGFVVVALNHRLTAAEKISRTMEVDRRHGLHVALSIDKAQADRLVKEALAALSGEGQPTVQERDYLARAQAAATKAPAPKPRPTRARTLFAGRSAATDAQARTTRALGRSASGAATARRHDEMARQDAVESIIHFAEHAASVFDISMRALVMFTSGTTGHSKAVSLTWENICASAEVSNKALNVHGEGLWQVALPLFHIGGYQVVVRSILNGSPFALYERFDAKELLRHGTAIGATHVSVVDKMLQDLIATGMREALARYQCVLLGGGPLNPQTLQHSCAVGARVFASYGMTETASQIANCLVTPAFNGGLNMLEGYTAQIVDPDEEGVGRLAVKGPGLFEGYLNARAAFTVDGFFLTGDTAAIIGGQLYVKERTRDMFVSGGENVYPAEICEKLLAQPGVRDAYVFGAPDARWGRRPVAFVEHDPAAVAQVGGNYQMELSIREDLRNHLSKIYMPKDLFVVDQFPRSGIGKVDRGVLEESYRQRIELARVVLYRVRIPFRRPFKTPKSELCIRESVIVEVTDYAGRTGLSECVSFLTDWYLPETLDEDVRVMRETIAPLLIRTLMLHPGEADKIFAAYPQLDDYPMARAALEQALWDLYGKIVEKPLWQLIGGTTAGLARPVPGSPTSIWAPAGAVIPVCPVSEAVALARQAVEAGYTRLKLKITPNNGYNCTAAVREMFPDMMISVDANQSFTERQIDELKSLDALDLAWIEEPLNPLETASAPSADIFARLSRLQKMLATPVCVDESIAHPRDLARALAFPNLKCYAVKVGKFGGVEPTLQFMKLAQARGMATWMSGMYDSGISRRYAAAFETLTPVVAPGDIGSTKLYFATDLTLPPYEARKGLVLLNPAGYDYGIGCELNREALQQVLMDRIVITAGTNR